MIPERDRPGESRVRTTRPADLYLGPDTVCFGCKLADGLEVRPPCRYSAAVYAGVAHGSYYPDARFGVARIRRIGTVKPYSVGPYERIKIDYLKARWAAETLEILWFFACRCQISDIKMRVRGDWRRFSPRSRVGLVFGRFREAIGRP